MASEQTKSDFLFNGITDTMRIAVEGSFAHPVLAKPICRREELLRATPTNASKQLSFRFGQFSDDEFIVFQESKV